MSLSVKIFVVFLVFVAVKGQSLSNITLNCNRTDVTMIINKTYIASLTSETVDGIYIVNPNNAVQMTECQFTDTGALYVYTVNSTTASNCYVNMTSDATGTNEMFVVQLFTTATPPISFSPIMRWNFICSMQVNYTVSSARIQPYSFSFNGISMTRSNYQYSALFFNDSAFTEQLNPARWSYPVNSSVYLQISVIASTNIHLSINNCTITKTNSNSFSPITLVASGCPSGSNTLEYTSDNASARIVFPAFLDTPDSASDEFFVVTCLTTICNEIGNTCTRPSCSKRKKRSLPNEWKDQRQVSAYFHVRNPCADAGCSHTCKIENQRFPKCLCPDGLSLNRDGKHCNDASTNNQADSDEPSNVEDPSNPLPNDQDSNQPEKPESNPDVPHRKPEVPDTHPEEPEPDSSKNDNSIEEQSSNDEVSGEDHNEEYLPIDFSSPQSILLLTAIGFSAVLFILLMALLVRRCRSTRRKWVPAEDLSTGKS